MDKEHLQGRSFSILQFAGAVYIVCYYTGSN